MSSVPLIDVSEIRTNRAKVTSELLSAACNVGDLGFMFC